MGHGKYSVWIFLRVEMFVKEGAYVDTSSKYMISKKYGVIGVKNRFPLDYILYFLSKVSDAQYLLTSSIRFYFHFSLYITILGHCCNKKYLHDNLQPIQTIILCLGLDLEPCGFLAPQYCDSLDIYLTRLPAIFFYLYLWCFSSSRTPSDIFIPSV